MAPQSLSLNCTTLLSLSLLFFSLSLAQRLNQVTEPRPSVDDLPKFSRWLVAQSSWGVLSTLRQDKRPFANIISFADGGTGVPYFYLSPALDPTGMNAVNDSRASFALSEAILGFCATTDPQSPACAKITLSGDLQLLQNGSPDAEFGQNALFAKHPQLKGFPLMANKFNVFKMVINDISLVTKPALRQNLPPHVYFEGEIMN